jgi:hypothetical protein
MAKHKREKKRKIKENTIEKRVRRSKSVDRIQWLAIIKDAMYLIIWRMVYIRREKFSTSAW